MPQETQEVVMTLGKNEKHYLAGALHLATGKLLPCLALVKTMDCFAIS
jgi:hypothetical protein